MTFSPYTLHLGNSLDAYDTWAGQESPVTIISDGAYGVGGFDGDPKTTENLGEWYEPHIKAWAKHSTPHTALWFWNTELGWATVHPYLQKHGWKYVQLAIWDKGIGHIAGNVNSKTIRRFPVVTEVVALYCREPVFESVDSALTGLTMQEWMRAEWKRAGLSFAEANTACGVKNAASRKYFASDHLWYEPPSEHMKSLISYARENGKPLVAGETPYFAVEGSDLSTESGWNQQRYQWNHAHGLTNVFSRPALRNSERIKVNGKNLHTNQKPLDLCEYLIHATTSPQEAVWEPFGGVGSISVAAVKSGRRAYYGEIHQPFYDVARERLKSYLAK
jgi:site-specific DNA-methyltransferase (adenine-specific)